MISLGCVGCVGFSGLAWMALEPNCNAWAVSVFAQIGRPFFLCLSHLAKGPDGFGRADTLQLSNLVCLGHLEPPFRL